MAKASPGLAGRWSCDGGRPGSWKAGRRAATPTSSRSSAATAVMIPAWTTARGPDGGCDGVTARQQRIAASGDHDAGPEPSLETASRTSRAAQMPARRRRRFLGCCRATSALVRVFPFWPVILSGTQGRRTDPRSPRCPWRLWAATRTGRRGRRTTLHIETLASMRTSHQGPSFARVWPSVPADAARPASTGPCWGRWPLGCDGSRRTGWGEQFRTPQSGAGHGGNRG